MSERTEVFIALGSNLGDRRGHIEWAAGQLEGHLDEFRLSSILESAPLDVPDVQPPYLNAVATGRTRLTPTELLELLLELERLRGRDRRSYRAARTLDLDLILYGSTILETRSLALPHPRFRARFFVLEPLVELAPDAVDPVSGRRMAALLTELRSGQSSAS